MPKAVYTEKMDKLETFAGTSDFYIIFNECDKKTEKYYAILFGVLNNNQTYPTHFVCITKEDESTMP